MDRTLTRFIAALRNAEVRISPAETLDAMNALELVGFADREFLKNSLSMVLPKTPDEKDTFETTFDQFFSFEDVSGKALSSVEKKTTKTVAMRPTAKTRARAAVAAKAAARGRKGEGKANSPPRRRKRKTSAQARCRSPDQSSAGCSWRVAPSS